LEQDNQFVQDIQFVQGIQEFHMKEFQMMVLSMMGHRMLALELVHDGHERDDVGFVVDGDVLHGFDVHDDVHDFHVLHGGFGVHDLVGQLLH